MADALDPDLQGVSFDTREALIYSRIGELPEDAIDLLAWQFHVDFYEPVGLTPEIKRGLVKTSILVHKRKGTRWAVQELCDIVFGNTAVHPWFEYNGEPYHFNVSTYANLPTAGAWEKFFHALEVTKSVRDWLDAIELRRDIEATIYCGIGTLETGAVEINIARVEGQTIRLMPGIGKFISGNIILSTEEVEG
jgi:phage tail P2-like protein